MKKNQKKDPPIHPNPISVDLTESNRDSSVAFQTCLSGCFTCPLPRVTPNQPQPGQGQGPISARWPRGEHGAEQGIARVSQQGDDGSHKTVDVPGRWDRWQTASAKIRQTMPPSLPKLGQKSNVSNSVGSKFDHPILVESQKKRNN